YDHAGSQPRTGADADRGVDRPLPPDRDVGVGVAVVLVRDVDVRAGEDVIADVDGLMRDDMAPPADDAPVADPQHGLRPEIMPRGYARADRGLLADHGPVANLDP